MCANAEQQALHKPHGNKQDVNEKHAEGTPASSS